MINPFRGIKRKDFLLVGLLFCLSVLYFVNYFRNIYMGILYGTGYLFVVIIIAGYIEETVKQYKLKRILKTLLYGVPSIMLITTVIFCPMFSEIHSLSIQKSQIEHQKAFNEMFDKVREKMRKDMASGEWQKRQAELRKQYMKQHPGKDPQVSKNPFNYSNNPGSVRQ